MAHIPVITGFGGVNASGRSSGHHGYRRTVIDALGELHAEETWRSLAALMNIEGPVTAESCAYMRDHTLIRRIESSHFDPAHVPWNRRLALQPSDGPISFVMARRNVPRVLPQGWTVHQLDRNEVRVEVSERFDMFIEDFRRLEVSAAGQLPTGFDPKQMYASRSHPRGLQMAVYGASDALGSLGIDWQRIAATVPADKISCYAGSAMSQLDADSNGGLIASRYLGKRVTSKHVALGLAEMPADFVNAYILGSMGGTGHNMGACATFLYNLRQGVQDIRTGSARVVIVGAAEAPLVPEVFDGYATMRALATDQELLELDQALGLETPDLRRACRPFALNCGFSLAEAAQFIVLMDDELALELGADIYGAVGDVFINADGHKKSISAPGVGNYLTVARAVALGRTIVGEESMRHRSFVHAHGTGTPANRRTESRILDQTASAFGIENWPVAAIKCYLGHSVAAAGGDQIMSTLGIWAHGIIPGIATMDRIADDVSHRHLQLSSRHLERGVGELDVAIVNSKGFGGNNATATVVAPQVMERLLGDKHGAKAMTDWRRRLERTREQAAAHDAAASAGEAATIYRFDHQVRKDEHVHISADAITVEGYDKPISLDLPNPFE